MEIESRRLHVLGVTANPDGRGPLDKHGTCCWSWASAAAVFRYLIRDRAGQFTATFDTVLADAGISVPAHARHA